MPASRSTDSNRFSAARSPGWMGCFPARCRRYRSTMQFKALVEEWRAALSNRPVNLV